jgi:hypothetical protein
MSVVDSVSALVPKMAAQLSGSPRSGWLEEWLGLRLRYRGLCPGLNALTGGMGQSFRSVFLIGETAAMRTGHGATLDQYAWVFLVMREQGRKRQQSQAMASFERVVRENPSK